MIALTTTERSVADVARRVSEQRAWIDAVELRVDLLDPDEQPRLLRLPALLDDAALPLIATVRRVADGGRSELADADRMRLLVSAIESGYRYVDLESDLDPAIEHEVIAAANRRGANVIRSCHDFSGVPADLTALVGTLRRSPEEIEKWAVTPRSTAELVLLLQAADGDRGRRHIVIGMGEFGFITRVLMHRFGNHLTFASAPGEEAAPGHISPQLLRELYRVPAHTDRTTCFAVIGNPIAHSRSPEYHNARFIEEGLDACYVPILIDDVHAFGDLLGRLPLAGVSVTIPHKRAVIDLVEDPGDEVRAADACNTIVVGADGKLHGTNTDVVGFLAPLEESYGAALEGAHVLVLGAGGAARGVVYALLSRGACVTLWNRTPERALSLRDDLAAYTGPGRLDVLGPGTADDARYDVVVNTTSAGMRNDNDPAPWYAFTGNELAYDIVYTPPETPFIVRAVSAGCRVVTGDRMFAAQAAAQYELYRTLAIGPAAGA